MEYEQHLPAQEPEPAEESASYEPAPAEEPVSYEQGLPGHEPEAAAPAEEPVTYEHDQAAHDPQSAAHEPEPAELEPEEHEPEEHEAAEHEAAEPAPAGGAAEPESEDAAGHAIPGLAPVERTIPKPERLPPSPPRVGGREKPPMRRAFRRGAPAAGAPLVEPRRRRRRTVFTRLAAVVALAAVAVVVILIVHSLSGSGSSKAPAGPPVVKVLIPEGKTRLQIAQIAAAAGLTGDYRRETKHSPLLNPAHYGAPADTPDLEGFLFPATYDMDKGGPVGRLVEEQLTAFQENFGPETVARAKALGVTPYQLLTVASMVEREAQVPSDRAKIAAVIYNRLKAGMPLGIDASIYYAVEMAKGVPTYTHELTESQLHIDSPYNTRLHTGLPPTPISNPGTASIYAAAHPSHVGYLYYVAGADGCGEQVFSESQAKFEEDVAAYEAAKRANGGHPPACKHS